MDKYPVKKHPEDVGRNAGFEPRTPKGTHLLPKFTEAVSEAQEDTGRLTNPTLIGYSKILAGDQPAGDQGC